MKVEGNKIKVEERIAFTESSFKLLKEKYDRLSTAINNALKFSLNDPNFIDYFNKNVKEFLLREDLIEKREKIWLEKEVFEKFSIVLSIVVYLGFENLQSRNRKMIKKIIKKYLKGEKLNIEEKEYIEMMYKKLEDLREIIK